MKSTSAMKQIKAIDPEGEELRGLIGTECLNGARVLEIGAGTGRLALRCVEAGGNVVGVEPSPDDVREAAHAVPRAFRHRVRFVRATALGLPFRPGAFDVAVLGWSL
jgi:ubiquinone/menaquinone biosynthesis C-methylase UbiE